MNAIIALNEVLSQKDDAITTAIAYIQGFSECSDKTCEKESNYHWRGCPITMKPILDQLLKAFQAR